MQALDFFTVCAGVSLIILSAGFITALIVKAHRSARVDARVAAPVQHERQPLEPTDPLARRLHEFQETRFASPIVRRQLEQDVVPIRDASTLPRPPRRSPK